MFCLTHLMFTKYLDNNGNATSTVGNSTGTSTSILTTGDGYKWKYMYTLSFHNKQTFYQQTLWQSQLTQLLVQMICRWC